MSTSSRFYLQQAENCELAASSTPLDNQRRILLQSRAVWLGLAAREIEVQTARAERERTAREDREQAGQLEIAHER